MITYLLLGFFFNLAMAWGILLWPRSNLKFTGPWFIIGSREVGWECAVASNNWGFGYVDQHAFGNGVQPHFDPPTPLVIGSRDLLPRWAYARRHDPPVYELPRDTNITLIQAYDRAAGWPMLSVRGREVLPFPQVPGSVLSGHIDLPRWVWWRMRTIIPGELLTRPMPLGTAVNTLFYAGILALPRIPALWRHVRGRSRRRRGRCPACNYPRAGLEHDAPCPECGLEWCGTGRLAPVNGNDAADT